METLSSEDIDLVALAGYLSTSPLLSLGLARGYPHREESSIRYLSLTIRFWKTLWGKAGGARMQ